MKKYELLYVVSGDKAEDEVTKVTDAVNAALLAAGGTVDDENFWGRRRLAYQIAKQTHGWYVVTRFSIDPAQLADFQHALRLNQEVVRTLTLSADDVPTAEEAEQTLAAVSQSAAKAAKLVEEAATPPAQETVKKAEQAPAKPVDEKERKAQLDEKLGEILKDG